MNLLFITARYPYPPLRGDQLRAYYQIRLLAQEHRVTLVSFNEGWIAGRSEEALAALCESIHVVRTSRIERLHNLALATCGSLPFQAAYYLSSEMFGLLRNLARTKTFDAAIIQLSRMAPYCVCLGEIPVVLDFVDSAALNVSSRLEWTRGPACWIWSLERARLERFERSLCKAFSGAAVVAPSDRDYLGCSDIAVVPNGVDVKRIPFTSNPREPEEILFVGNMGYGPNEEAALFLAKEVYSRVQMFVPGVRLTIVGARPGRRIRRLARLPGVTVTGYVESVVPYLSRATVGVYPIMTGSGMQNKVLESMAAGLPVVATPFVLRGIEATPGEHLVVGRTSEEIAEQVITLLGDADGRLRFAERARRFVERRYTWEASVDALEKLLVEQRITSKSGVKGVGLQDGKPRA